MQNVTVFKVPLWKNDYHRFCNSIRIYRLVRIRALAWSRHHKDISHSWPNIRASTWRDIAELTCYRWPNMRDGLDFFKFLVWRLDHFRFISQWRFICLPNIFMDSSRCIIVSLFVFSIKVIQIGAIRSTETCRLAFIIVVIIMLFQRGVWKIFVYEVSAALDTKFNGLCVSAKTKFKIGTNEVPSLDQVLNHFSYDLSYLSIPFWTTCTYVAVFSSIYPILLVCF